MHDTIVNLAVHGGRNHQMPSAASCRAISMLILASVCSHEERQPSKEISNFATSHLGRGSGRHAKQGSGLADRVHSDAKAQGWRASTGERECREIQHGHAYNYCVSILRTVSGAGGRAGGRLVSVLWVRCNTIRR